MGFLFLEKAYNEVLISLYFYANIRMRADYDGFNQYYCTYI